MRIGRWGAAALLLVLAACGSSDSGVGDQAEAGTTSSPARPTPTEAFTAGWNEITNGDGIDEALALGEAVCSGLDAAQGVLTDDAPNDSPETDASIVAETSTMVIGTAFTPATDPEVSAAVLRLAGEHLCPDHLAVILADLVERGL